MNVIWSRYVQGIRTLYESRKLRFDDLFADQYQPFFQLDSAKPLKILEIGCGPGALAGALHRWYPQAEITAIDRDTDFIAFARKNEQGVTFLEGDATDLPFADGSFDITISNTVSEHIEPSKFYGEQRRVLRSGGVCLVLSSRKGISVAPSCFTESEFETRFWKKVSRLDDTMQKYGVCRYPLNEARLPLTMREYGFSEISTGYATIDLVPDHARYSARMAYRMINANRYGALDSLDSIWHAMPDQVSPTEIDEMRRLVNERYDARLRDYDAGRQYWEVDLSLIQMVRGIKSD